jgi:YesN/AraC family two-component response regulator
MNSRPACPGGKNNYCKIYQQSLAEIPAPGAQANPGQQWLILSLVQEDGPVKLLLVDDEESIRATLPAVLEGQGFDVTAVATVPEALRLISQQKFDILIADLNVGNPGDGFTIVSAMRRTQPDAATVLLTGYPGFDAALEAIRQQVDSYLLKPASVQSFVEVLQATLAKRRVARTPLKGLAEILQDNRECVIRDWLAEVKKDAELSAIRINDTERTDHLPRLLDEALSRARGAEFTSDHARAAALHGATRRKQGYSIPLLIREAKILQVVIGNRIQKNLLEAKLSNLVPDMTRITETIQTELESSLRAYLKTLETPAPVGKSGGRKRKLKHKPAA